MSLVEVLELTKTNDFTAEGSDDSRVKIRLRGRCMLKRTDYWRERESLLALLGALL